MRNWIIKKLGGFPNLDSAISHIREIDDKVLKHKILSEAVKHLYNAIGPEDILKTENGRLTFRGKPMTEAEEDLLKAEAQQLLNSKLWSVLRMDIRWQLNKKVFYEPVVSLDVVWGKLLMFHDDIMKTRLQQLTGKKMS